jgi:S1-C subfamily serine protease
MLAPAKGLTLADVESAVQKALAEKEAPPTAADAYESILPSVVHVRGLPYAPDADVEPAADNQSGTGVVIVDTGIILTNLHVVYGAKSIKVVFHDGLESDALVIGTQPEHDLAVLQAKTIPDDLYAATLRSTQGLRPGEPVVAVGFPFGIGPSVSAGVISGLGREYQTADGKRVLTNLIQFDAAVNPGNSGGPLITPEGEVIGIVTGLLNPTEHRVFIGIGFAVPIENAAGAVGLSPF